jgi:phage gpG-like protein
VHAPLLPQSAYPKKKKRNPSNIPLLDTGKLAGNFHANLGSNFVEIGPDAGYAEFHQEGTPGMVARPMVDESVAANKSALSDMRTEFASKGDIYGMLLDVVEDALL